jgi:hypothetical protein
LRPSHLPERAAAARTAIADEHPAHYQQRVADVAADWP